MGSSGGRTKSGLNKFQTQRTVTGTGTIGNSEYIVKGESTLRVSIIGSAPTTRVTILARIEGESTFTLLETITDNNTAVIDILTYDFVRFGCTVFGGTDFLMASSGFIPGQSITGTFTQSGLKTDFLTTTVDITDTEAAIPSLSGRNSMEVHNTDAVETLFLGKTGVTADNVVGTTSGKEVAPGQQYAIDLTNAVGLFAIARTGQTIRIKFTEIA